MTGHGSFVYDFCLDVSSSLKIHLHDTGSYFEFHMSLYFYNL